MICAGHFFYQICKLRGKSLGIAEVFLPGASLQDVVRLVSGAVPVR